MPKEVANLLTLALASRAVMVSIRRLRTTSSLLNLITMEVAACGPSRGFSAQSIEKAANERSTVRSVSQ